jgi:hypothetical protein
MDRRIDQRVAELWRDLVCSDQSRRSRGFGRFSKKDLRDKFAGYELPS